jgi:hypothetical protein
VETPGDELVLLFAYGTLQQPSVQHATFGRLLDGQADVLPGFALAPLQITDPAVIATSGKAVHTIAHPTGDPSDSIPGMVFRISPAELAAADSYEVADAKRIQVTLASGTRAYAYVSAHD